MNITMMDILTDADPGLELFISSNDFNGKLRSKVLVSNDTR